MALVFCPICGQQLDSESTQSMPFCSDRCRLIDLGRWLNEEHRLPIEPEDEEENRRKSERMRDARCEMRVEMRLRYP